MAVIGVVTGGISASVTVAMTVAIDATFLGMLTMTMVTVAMGILSIVTPQGNWVTVTIRRTAFYCYHCKLVNVYLIILLTKKS